MPNTKSAIKAARQNLKHRQINLAALDKIKSTIKLFKKLTSSNKAEEARKSLSQAFAALDKAAKKHIIHKNTADRRKSRLAKLLAKATAK